jgi:uncharacterized protein (TIGR02596 family)
MKRPKGFSLVEMLVVLTVVSILALLAVAGFSSTREANIANGAQMVKGALKLARQIAVAQNRVTEVRFYENTTTPTGGPAYAALRVEVYDVTGTTATPASHIIYLPAGVIMVADTSYSTLLSPTTNPATRTENLPSSALRSYTVVQFRPTGITTLSAVGSTPAVGTSDQWFVTLKLASDPLKGSLPSANFVAVQVNPVTGETLLYQP